jgi:hypothetical protein
MIGGGYLAYFTGACCHQMARRLLLGNNQMDPRHQFFAMTDRMSPAGSKRCRISLAESWLNATINHPG